jgi:hypothetical protein
MILSLLLFLGACGTTSAPEELSRGTLAGGILGYGGEDYEYWNQWEAREAAPMAIVERDAEPRLFDSWRVEDAHFRESLWDGTFHLLSALASAVPDEERPGIQLVQSHLGAELEDARFEIAFFTRADASGEGLVLRIVAPHGPGVWLEAERAEGDDGSPRWWTLRVEPAFEQALGLTAWWEQSETEEHTAMALGAAAMQGETPLPRPFADADAGWWELFDLLEKRLWQQVTERRHVEPAFTYSLSESDDELAPGWPPTLGMPVAPRGLTEFLSHSVFWPRP